MRIKTIVYPKGRESSRYTLELTQTQIEELCSQDARGMKVLLNHDESKVIGSMEKLEMDKHGRMVGYMKITDKEAKKKVMDGSLIGASIGTINYAIRNPIPTVTKKELIEISLTDDPDRKEALIKTIETKGNVIKRTRAGVYKIVGTVLFNFFYHQLQHTKTKKH